ncbi:hypothetical protein [Streptomyces boninensis]|uniref:hypothetical protein n=1 Tax=Streptomyces boninensis TaxID=2039455 RepID=UPI003B221D6D
MTAHGEADAVSADASPPSPHPDIGQARFTGVMVLTVAAMPLAALAAWGLARRRSTGQVVGNLLVFAALGFLAPLRFAALASRRWWRATPAASSGRPRAALAPER